MSRNYCVIAAVCMLVCGCQVKQEDGNLVRSVITTSPITAEKEAVKRFSGIVNEGREIAVGFKTPGQIQKIYTHEGDYVKEGQLLAVLDDKDYMIGVQSVEIQYKQLQNEVSRIRKLYEAQSVSGNDYEKAVAGLEQLQMQLQANKNKLEYTKLYAPSSGYIQKSNFENSEMVDAGTPVFTLLDTKNMEVTLNVPSDVYLKKENISEITCRTNVQPDKSYRMRIISASPKADGNQLYQMRLGFVKPVASLPSGINVEVLMKLDKNKKIHQYSLPLKSVFNHDGKAFVYVLDNDTIVREKEINLLGVDSEGNALTDTPFETSDKIVRSGVNALHNGEKVKIVNEKSKTNVGDLM